MISGRRPKRPDAQYYRQSRKRPGGGGSLRGRGNGGLLSPGNLTFAGVVLAVAGFLVWWFRA